MSQYKTLIAIDEDVVNEIIRVLRENTQVIAGLKKTNEELQAIADKHKLFNEAEAMAYLRRDANTLLYYRKNGLPYYKNGRDVWYNKGDIDDWLASSRVNRRAH